MAPTGEGKLLVLQGQCKRDPESYTEEFRLQWRHYKATLAVFVLRPSEESHEFAQLVNFVSQVSFCYADKTTEFVTDVSDLLEKHYNTLDSSLRHTLVKALILLRNRDQVSALTVLPLFFRLFKCQDKSLRQLLFRHIIADIKGANKRHHNDSLNRAVQSFLYGALQDPNEAAAKKSLAVLIELWSRQVWRDARTVNVIASAAVHESPRIVLAALKFFLGQDEDTGADSDDDDDEGQKAMQPSKADVYKATKKGTAASKKKKEKKLQRVMAAVKKQKRKASHSHENFAAIQLLHDPQRFAEELFKRLNKSSGERFEVRLAMMSVVSRVVGVHKLLLLNFYPFLQRYILPHQREAPSLLAIMVQAVHDEVPPDVLTPVLRQLVDQFVHDRARPEVMSLGLKTVRSLCERTPLVMTPELLQDLALYKKFREKEVASAARSLIALFRELAPGMLEKRDRGRDADLATGPRAFGERAPASRVEGAELLQAALERGDEGSTDPEDSDLDDDSELGSGEETGGSEDDGEEMEEAGDSGPELAEREWLELSEGNNSDAEAAETFSTSEQDEALEDREASGGSASSCEEESSPEEALLELGVEADGQEPDFQGREPKRKRSAVEGSLSSLKRQVAEASKQKSDPSMSPAEGRATVPLEYERILDEDDFARIRQLRHKKMVADLMRKHGLKSAAKRQRLLAAAEDEADEALDKQDMRAYVAEQRIDPEELKGSHKLHKSKADKMKAVLEGREGREFGAAASRKNKKTGGKSNKEKLKSKNLPLGARKAVVRRRGSKQRVGKKNFASKKKLR